MGQGNKQAFRIGVDSGGTFTDFVIHSDGQLQVRKLPSSPDDPSRAIIEGLKDYLGPGTLVIHGTTVGTNTLLEKKGARLAFLTTRGFEDIVFIGRQTRKNLYSLSGEKRDYLLSPRLCFGLEERVLAGGRVETPLRMEEVDRIIRILKKEKVEAVAVCLLHSYANPVHEKIVAESLSRAGFRVSASFTLLPEYREYERASTTIINAYLLPVIDRYLVRLQENLAGAELKIMQSNEGYITVSKARREPIRTILSGPTGGVVGAYHLARQTGFRRVISFDMGGTSTDVSLIDGRIKISTENLIGEHPIRLPMVDVHSVGAGGGSIVFVDSGGLLRVGPQSVGANPGPACYGQGDIPAVTDANLILGRLDPDYFLGGRMKIYPEKSRRALETVARKIGRSLVETALGVVAIANASMEKAIRVISVERGYDPRQFTLISFGGAGGLHAVEIAEHLRIPRVIVPRMSGVLSAFGLLLADAVRDYSRSFLKLAQKTAADELEKEFREMIIRAREEMAEDGFDPDEMLIERQLDLRYLGQSHELTVPCRADSLAKLKYLEDFHRQHRRLFSYHHPHRPVEIVNLRLRAIIRSPEIKPPVAESSRHLPPEAKVKKQQLYYGRTRYLAAVFDRSRLLAGNRIPGPALVVDAESTTLIPPGYEARTDSYLNLIIERAGRP
ncbi:MAG: hydantoinase/oxoprolinase family protein [Candidatus Saccharicenans sp.]|nr:hydantoinase/oxoprolinase family protein [Candidatus Saccharicenans sp.]